MLNVVIAVAAVIAALTGACLWWWALRDRSALVVVSVRRWKASDILIILTAQMKRGRPVTMYHVGAHLDDGSRKEMPRYDLHAGQIRALPQVLTSNAKIEVAVSAAHVWAWLVASNRGSEDVSVSLYVQDGAGSNYDSTEWVVFNATTRSMSLRRRDDE